MHLLSKTLLLPLRALHEEDNYDTSSLISGSFSWNSIFLSHICPDMQKKHSTETVLPSSEEGRGLAEPEASDRRESDDTRPQADGQGDGQTESSREPSSHKPFSKSNGEHRSPDSETSPAKLLDGSPSPSPSSASSKVLDREAGNDTAAKGPSDDSSSALVPTVSSDGSSAIVAKISPSAKDRQRSTLQSAFENLKDRAKQMEDLLADCNRMAADSTKKVHSVDYTLYFKHTRLQVILRIVQNSCGLRKGSLFES